MGYTHEARFKKKFKLEKNWNMSLADIEEVTDIDQEVTSAIYHKHLEITKSRSKAMNEVFGYCLKTLFPKEKCEESTNGRSGTD